MNFGIIGTGKISRSFLEAARRVSGVTVGALLTREMASGTRFAEEMGGGISVYTDAEAFFSSGITAVYVASPNCAHAAQAEAALSHGLHVLLEKPAVDAPEKFASLARMAEERSLVLLEAMRPLHLPFFATLRNALTEIGRLRRVTLEYCQYSSRYDAFLAGEVKNAFNPALSNAAVMDIGVYPAALACALFGAPQSVDARSVFLSNGFEGCGEAILGYGDFTLSLVWSKITDSATPSVFLGERGALLLDRVNNPTEIRLILRNWDTRVLRNEPCENDMIYEIADFCDMAAGQMDPAPFTRCTAETQALLAAIREKAGIRF